MKEKSNRKELGEKICSEKHNKQTDRQTLSTFIAVNCGVAPLQNKKENLIIVTNCSIL